jgi:hypothetical protein
MAKLAYNETKRKLNITVSNKFPFNADTRRKKKYIGTLTYTSHNVKSKVSPVLN